MQPASRTGRSLPVVTSCRRTSVPSWLRSSSTSSAHDTYDGRSTERRPAWLYDVGDEPDPRYSLANERTFLAWVRTALGLFAGAVALHSLGVPDPTWLRSVIVVGWCSWAALSPTLAFARWARVETGDAHALAPAVVRTGPRHHRRGGGLRMLLAVALALTPS